MWPILRTASANLAFSPLCALAFVKMAAAATGESRTVTGSDFGL